MTSTSIQDQDEPELDPCSKSRKPTEYEPTKILNLLDFIRSSTTRQGLYTSTSRSASSKVTKVLDKLVFYIIKETTSTVTG